MLIYNWYHSDVTGIHYVHEHRLQYTQRNPLALSPLADSLLLPFLIPFLFFTQQYRLFSKQCTLQMDVCYSGYTRIINTIFGIRKLLFVGIRYVGDSPSPSPDWYCCRIGFCRNSYRKWIAVEVLGSSWVFEFCQRFLLSPPPKLVILGFVYVEISR